ncbi:MAG: hypothetical protein WCD70_02260 [Alphaproteobacteria bacterium]
MTDHEKQPNMKFTRDMVANTPPELLAQIEAETGLTVADAIFDPDDGDFLAPDLATEMFLENPASVGFNLYELPYIFDLTHEDIGQELAAGRLIGFKAAKQGQQGYTALVSGKDLFAWANNSETPKYIRKRLKKITTGEVAFFMRRAKCVPIEEEPTGPFR